MRGIWLALGLLVAVSAGCGEDGDDDPPDTVIDMAPPALGNQSRVEITFSALGKANTFFCRLDDAQEVQCLSPFVTNLTDGPHTFTVAAALNRNVDETPATASFTIDSVAPTTELLSAPPAVDGSPSPLFTFQGSDDGGVVTFECSLDAGTFTACASPLTLTVGDGTHNFKVRARDPAGNVDATPAAHGWTVDTTTPDTTITLGPATGSTSAATGSFAFTSPIGSVTFECAFDGAPFAACTSPVPFSLDDGDHTFQVRAVGIGGPDPTPATRTWTVDAIAPDVTVTIGPSNPSNVAAPSFTFGSTDATAVFVCKVDADAFAACTSPFTTASLADGAHVFTVRATDGVGNATTTTFSWSIDTIAPTVTITAAPPAATNNPTPSVTFTTAGSPVAVECAVDVAAFAPCTSPFTAAELGDGPHQIAVRATDAAGNSTTATAAFEVDTIAPVPAITSAPTLTNDNRPSIDFVVTGATIVDCRVDTGAFVPCTAPFKLPALSDGTHTFEVRGRDAAGNSATASATFTVDTIAPTVTITSRPAAISSNTTPTVAFITGGSPTDVTCTVDGGAPLVCVSPFTPAALPDGPHAIVVRATDAAGNTTAATVLFEIDTVAPTVVITDAPPAITADNAPAIAFVTAGSPTQTTCQLDAAAPIPCASPFAPGTLPDGPHTVVIRVQDAAANASTATTSFTVDATSPPVLITRRPPPLTNNNTPTFVFEVTGAPIAIECKVDAGPFVACTSPFTTGTLDDGPHTVVVRATDAAGNIGSAAAAFTVDATPPTLAITAQPVALSNNNTPTVAFTSGGGVTSTQCQLDNGTLVACTSPFTRTIPDGDHTITVRVADAAGNVTTATTDPFTIDTQPPTVVITAQPVALSNDDTPTVTFTIGGDPTTIECRVDTGAFAACTSPFTPTVADGTHTITVRVTDAAGNIGSATSTTFTVDTDPPTITLGTPPAALSNNRTPTLTFTALGADTIRCRVDSGTFVNCTSPFTSVAIADGSHTITVRVADNAGNSNVATTAPFEVDTTPPTLTLDSVPLALSNNPSPSVAFTVGGDPATVECRVDAGAFAACTSPFSATVADGAHTITVRATDAATNATTRTTASFVVDTIPPTVTLTSQPPPLSNDNTPTITFTTAGDPNVVQCRVDGGPPTNNCTSPFTAGPLADGSHVISVRVVDGAGNNATVTTNTFVIDTAPPSVTILTQPAALSNDDTPTVTFDTDGAPTIIECRLDGDAFVACTSPFTVTVVDGTHTISVRVTDAAGNQVTAITDPFTVDTIPPTLTITSQPALLSNVTTPTVAFTVAGATTVQCRVDSGAFAACTSPFTSAALLDGDHTITVRAADGAGNQTTRTTATFTIDTVAPTATLTSQPPALGNSATVQVAFTTAGNPNTIQCAVDAGAFAACTSPFSATVEDGTHTISVRVTDGAGNTSTTTTNLFTVDTDPPEVEIDSETPPANDNTPTITFVVTGASTVTCTVDGNAPVACTSPFTTGVLADGSHTIVVTAADAAGNTGSASVSFVIDTTPPTVAITGGPVGPTAADQTQITFTASGDAATIECRIDAGSFAACASPFDPGTLAAGPHTVTVRVKDAATNQASAAISFEVDPTVFCLAGARGDGEINGTVEDLSAVTAEWWFRAGSAGDAALWSVSIPALAPAEPRIAVAFDAGELVVTTDATQAVEPGAVGVRRFALPGAVTDWHHYALVFDGVTQKLFVDGVAVTGTQASGLASVTFADVLPGFDAVLEPIVLSVGPADGAVLDLRFSKIARFTTSFTPEYPAAADANTVLLFPLDEGATDTSFDDVAAKQLTWPSAAGWGQCFGGL
ncbi:MAG: Ig-like domain repeat protein [Deltaproteobacteria bacterium]|nr:Ig-like domain repeat protein [Deltaproteobacteria bacterium]